MNRPIENFARLRGLYVITSAPNHVSIARSALRGGCRIIQLRDHQMPVRKLREVAYRLRLLTRNFSALFIINDHLELAREIGADGLHLEWAPFQVQDARQELGEKFLISTGVGSVQAALEAQKAGADYLGVGPVYTTESKPDAGSPIGLKGLWAICEAVSIPVAAIGGLNSDNIAGIEAPMICVLSALANASNSRSRMEVVEKLIAATQKDTTVNDLFSPFKN